MGECKLTIGQLSLRIQQRRYTGPVVTGVGSNDNYAYAASDAVPVGKYWLVLAASILIDCGGGVSDPPNQAPQLYLVYPGAILPPNIGQNPTYAQQAIFLSHVLGKSSFGTICNGLPLDPGYAMRIDESTNDDVGSPAGWTTPNEVCMIRGKKPLVLPQGYALIGHNGGDINAGAVNAQLTLKIQFIELAQTEDVHWI